MLSKNKVQLKKQAQLLPHQPGVYLFKDAKGTPLYIGKAKDLNKRVGSYFSKPDEKAKRIVIRSKNLEMIIVNSEVEALILESNLIKQHHPRYNIELKDDKNFLYLKIDLNQNYSPVELVRRVDNPRAKYFGPFTNAKQLRTTIKLLRKIFPFRTCDAKINSQTKVRPCLDYHLGICLAPCKGDVSRENYREVVKGLILFLEGKDKEIIKDLEQSLDNRSRAKNFEAAGKIRDRLLGFKSLIAKQRVISPRPLNYDLLGLAREGNLAVINLFLVRGGKLVGREYFSLKDITASTPREILGSFIQNYYQRATDFPATVIVSNLPDDKALLEKWLKQKSSHSIKIEKAQRGEKYQLLKLAGKNAQFHLEQLAQVGQLQKQFDSKKAVEELFRKINYRKLINRRKSFELERRKHFRIEGYDISNLQGKDAYGSMVVWELFRKRVEDKDKGKLVTRWLSRLAKDQYRIFRIKTIKKPDDYQMFREVLGRRFGHQHRGDSSFTTLPDLILIDGGKGQLNAALKVLEILKFKIPTISLAKKEEIIFTPISPRGIKLDQSSTALKLLQKIRDESHRFSLKFHHNLRSRKIKEETQ